MPTLPPDCCPAGVAILVARRDAADPAHNRELAAWLHSDMPAVQVYGHAAGLLGFDLLPDLTADKFGALAKPKASHPGTTDARYAAAYFCGAYTPNPANQCAPHSQVVGANALADYQLPSLATALFSSTASVWSQAGAAHYSASNCYLDALAHTWQAAGCPATAVNFGPFGDTGMAASLRCEGATIQGCPIFGGRAACHVHPCVWQTEAEPLLCTQGRNGGSGSAAAGRS